MIQSLTVEQLERFEATLCRSLHRPAWWEGAEAAPNALGKMSKHALDLRNEMQAETHSPDIRQQDIADLLNVDPGRIAEFFAGEPRGSVWTKKARRILQFVLLGREATNAQPAESRVVAQRILAFFFPMGDVEKQRGNIDKPDIWYFAERFRRSVLPQTSSEVEAELRSLCYSAKTEQANCRVIRVSGRMPFPQVSEDLRTLEGSGECTVTCLRAGVKVVYVFPKQGDDSTNSSDLEPATKSAHAFRRIVDERLAGEQDAIDRLEMRELSPDHHHTVDQLTRRAGEYFSPIMRWALYEREGQPTCLIASRSLRHGPCAFEPDPREIADFVQWVRCFVR